MFIERTSVGLDVHARSIRAHAVDTSTGEVFTTTLVPEPEAVIAWLRMLPGPIAVAYEAGPTGYWLTRAFTVAGIRCVVTPPSRLPRPAGDRVKTDKKDAALLSTSLAAGLLAQVTVPSVDQEDARDLTRARDDARIELKIGRQHISSFLLRRNVVYYDGQPWTGKHLLWLRRQQRALTGPGEQATFESYMDQLTTTSDRLARLDRDIADLAAVSPYGRVADRLACLRGIQLLTGFALAVEIGDWDRFTGATIGSFVGLTPSEDSSGPRVARGPITKAGNNHVRRLLIEAAWQHRKPYRPGRVIQRRWDNVDNQAVVARARHGNQRLHRRWATFDQRNKDTRTANAAIARELAGWCWSLAIMD